MKAFHDSLNQKNIVVLNVSMDTPFALMRIDNKLKGDNLNLLSDIKDGSFGRQYGVRIMDSALEGLLARSVFLLDENHNLVYRELVEDLATPPNYEAILAITS